MLLTISSASTGSSSKTHADWSSEYTRLSVPEAASPTCVYSHKIWGKSLESKDAVNHCTVTKRHDDNRNPPLAKSKSFCRSYREQERRETATTSTSAGASSWSSVYWSSKGTRISTLGTAACTSESFHDIWEKSRGKISRHAAYHSSTVMKGGHSGAPLGVRSTPKSHRPSYRQQERKEKALRGPVTRDADLEL